jgi:hypothetical protein
MSNVGQAVLSIGGAIVGGILGGPFGAKVGYLLGSAAGQALFPTDLGTIKGPRLDDLRVMSSAVGTPIPIVYGTFAVAGNVTWSSGLIESVHKEESGGKGGPSQTVKTYSYSVDCAVSMCEGPIQGIKRIWADAVVIYDLSPQGETESDEDYAKRVAATEQTASIMTVYLGDESQLADPTIEAYEGAGEVPAYRGLAYVVFEGFQLEKFGNRIPNLRFEVYSGTNDALYPWLTDSRDPTNSGNSNIFSSAYAVGGSSTDFSTLAAAVASVSTQQSWAYSDTVYGWSTSNNTATPIYPHDGDNPTESPAIRVWINRYDAALAGGSLSGASLCAVAAASFDGVSAWWSGNRNSLTQSHDHGVHHYAIDGSNPITSDATYSCGATRDYVSRDRDIIVSRNPAAPLDTADDPAYTAIPGAPGFFINSSGTVVRGVTWTLDNSTTYKVLQKYAATGTGTSDTVTAYPLGPARPLGHDEYSDQAFWEAAYAAAVADGDMAGGLTYGVDYPETQSYGYIGTCTTGSVDTDCVPIADIVEDLCARAGLTAVDVTDLATCIDGYCVTRVMSARDAIDPLRSVGLFDAVESGAVLKFVERGHTEVATLTADDLGAHTGGGARPTSVETSRVQEKELPKRLRFHYASAEKAYEPAQQAAARITTEALGEADVEVAVAMTDEKAAQLAEILLYSTWVARNSYSFQLDNSFLKVEPTDCLLLPVDGQLERVRVTGADYGVGGVITYTAAKDDDGNYESSAAPATGSSSGGGGGASGGLVCPSDAIFLDLPSLRTEDTDAGYYAAVRGLCSPWSCAVIYRSSDDGATYGRVADTFVEATIGTVLHDVGSANSPGDTSDSPVDYDTTNTLYVTLLSGEGLSSVTEASLLAGANTAAIGAHGRWELIQFLTAENTSGDVWELSGLVRGVAGTTEHIDTTLAGDAFVLMSGPGIVRIPETAAGIGVEKLLKVVSCGSTLEATTAETFTTQGLSYTPPTLGNLDDVDDAASTATDGDLLRYNATSGKWEPYAVGLLDLADVVPDSPLADGDVPAYDSISGTFIVQPQSGSGSPGGDVAGPVSSTANAIARWNGTAGDTLKDSGVTIDDSANVVGARTETVYPDGTTSYGFQLKGRQIASLAVPYFRPLTGTNTPIAFDIMPKGSPANFTSNTGVAWFDMCSTDIEADGTNYECLRHGIFTGGDAHISHAKGGTGTVRNLRFQINGGNVHIGSGSSPSWALEVNSATTPALAILDTDVDKFFFAQATAANNWFTGAADGDHCIRGVGGNIMLGSNSTTPGPSITISAGNPGNVTIHGDLTVSGTLAGATSGIPQNSQTADYTLVLGDADKHIYKASGVAVTITIPANGTVAFPIGTAVTFVNDDTEALSIAITTDTLVLAGAGTTGTRSLAQYGVATALKIGTTRWVISGTGLT